METLKEKEIIENGSICNPIKGYVIVPKLHIKTFTKSAREHGGTERKLWEIQTTGLYEAKKSVLE
jgi:hypothetical protein